VGVEQRQGLVSGVLAVVQVDVVVVEEVGKGACLAAYGFFGLVVGEEIGDVRQLLAIASGHKAYRRPQAEQNPVDWACRISHCSAKVVSFWDCVRVGGKMVNSCWGRRPLLFATCFYVGGENAHNKTIGHQGFCVAKDGWVACVLRP